MKYLILDPQLEFMPTEEQGELVAFGIGPARSVHALFSMSVANFRRRSTLSRLGKG